MSTWGDALPSCPNSYRPSTSETLRNLAKTPKPPVDNFQDISDYMTLYRQRQIKALTLKNHKKAEEFQNLQHNFSQTAQRSLFNRRCNSDIIDFSQRQQNIQKDISEIKDNSENAREHFEILAQERINKMKKRHEAELLQHDEKRPDKIPTSSKQRSSKLLSLAEQERRLSYQGRFSEAAELRQEIEEQNSQEEYQNQIREFNKWNLQRETILQKHQKEEEAMQQWLNAKRNGFKADLESQENAISNREKKLNYALNDKSTLLKTASPHTIRRNLIFSQLKSRSVPQTKSRSLSLSANSFYDIDKLSSKLPSRSREILLHF